MVKYTTVDYTTKDVPDHQSGHSSRRMLPSSSGASCCFIHRSGTYVADLQWLIPLNRYNVTHQREVTLHRTEEAIPVLLGGNDRRFSPVGTTEESRVFDPTFELLIPSICPNVVYVAGRVSILLTNREIRHTNYANNQLVLRAINSDNQRIIHDVDISQELAVVE